MPRSVQKNGLQPLGISTGGLMSRKRSEEHTSELQSRLHLVCRLLLEKKKKKKRNSNKTEETSTKNKDTSHIYGAEMKATDAKISSRANSTVIENTIRKSRKIHVGLVC